jgi:two-component system alkaline phosphatase synthesis response regulator PhoP
METQPVSFCPSCGEREIELLAGGDYVCTKCKVQFYIVKSTPTLSAGGLELHREARRVLVDKREVLMTQREFKILEFLMLHRGVVLDRDTIIKAVWDSNINIDGHSVDVTVRRIRMKIEPDQRKPQYILTTRGIGYSFTDKTW